MSFVFVGAVFQAPWLNLSLGVGNAPDKLDGFSLVGFKGVFKHHTHIPVLQKASNLGQLIVIVKSLHLTDDEAATLQS